MFKHLCRDNRGSAFVELALVLPLLAFVIIGAAELGRVAYYAIELASAARAGAAYGSQNTQTAGEDGTIASGTNDAIELAATNDAANIAITFPSAPGNYCVCETVNSTSGTVSDTASILCGTAPAGYCASSTVTGTTNTIISYVQVNTQATVRTMFHYPGIPTSFTLNGYAIMRVM